MLYSGSGACAVTTNGTARGARPERSIAMEWDLGLQGIGVLLAMATAFGVIVQLLMWRITTHWLWVIAAAGYFASGLFVSEVWFGWATEEDLQPNINGLSFDEVLLLAPLGGILVVLATWFVTSRTRRHPPLKQA
jgi:hypothetical protein